MPYTAEKPNVAPPRNVLENTIPGWGVDLDPKNRPAVPKENFNPEATGAHWHFPERQIARYERERSPEHKFLTPVFGTVCPPKGLSGLLRRYAYGLSEGRLSHWTLLVLADRIDVMESRITALFQLHPDNPITEMGLPSEIKRHGIRSRRGQRRADLKHLPIDVILFTGSTLLTVAGLAALGLGAARAARLLVRPKRRGLRRLLA